MTSDKQPKSLTNCSLGVSSFLWGATMSDASLTRLDQARSLGYDSLEIALDTPAALSAEKVHQRCADLNLAVTVCGVFTAERDLSHPEPKVRRQALDYMAQALDFCAAVGAPFLAGPMYAAVGRARMLTPEARLAEWNRSVEGLQAACELAATRQQKLAIEPLNRFETDLINTTEQLMFYLNQVDHPAAGVSLDTFHMNIEESNLSAAIHTAGDKLLHLQVADNHRGVPGQGSFQWDTLKSALISINYQGPIVVESFTTEEPALAEAVFFWRSFSPSQNQFARDALAFLRTWSEHPHYC